MAGKTYVIKDIFRHASFISEYKPLSDLYQTYTVNDGETPHTIAEQFYGASEYYWVILIFNNLYSMTTDWPLDQYTLERFCSQKYTDAHMYQTRHYERDDSVIGEVKDFYVGWTVPANPGPLDPTVYPVSFYDFEARLNDAKRKILILRPELLSEFLTQFGEAISG